MTMEGDGEKELPDEDKDEDKVTGNRLVGEGKNVDSVFKGETVKDDVKGAVVGTLQAKGSQLQQQEQSQGAAICWERFLHVTSIKVLLVENDNSTRHIVTALLRNCNYEVIEVANGLQAWKILENLTNQVDLVLSEVVMPRLSGIGLLCKIMNHKTRKNIPVIMMSSHDSVGIVFKSLSKGAADFLVKPIRKNELKNLWQHVWRRCLSSSGSGSESGIRTQKSVKSKSSKQSDNNSGKNDEEDIQGNGALGDGSDDGSGTQSLSTKQAVEVDRSQAVCPCDQAPKRGDSTCAHVIRSNTETSSHRNTHMHLSSYCQEEPDDTGKGKPTITGSLTYPEIEPENTTEVPFEHLGARHKSALEIVSNTSSLNIDKKTENPIGNCPPSEHNVVTAEMSHPQIDKAVHALEINSTSADDSKHCVVELSLKRLRDLRESGMTFQDDRNVLRRSELSAFSRYNSSSNLTRTPKGVAQGSYLIGDCHKMAKEEPLHDIEAHTNENLFNPRSNGVSNSMAVGPTTNILTSKPLPLRNTINSLHPSSAFKPVSSDCRSSSQQTPKVKPGDMQTADVHAPQSSHENIVIQYRHQHHNHHHIHNLDQHCSFNHEDLSLKKHGMNGLHCGPSNVLAGSCEGNPEYHSSSKSASGSNHRRNGQIGSSKDINAECTTGNCEAGSSGTSRSGGDANGSGSGNTMDPFKLVRAAALTKFRQKRKERCFMKKVRYQNRKKLADQRPRVRGQFVRHTGENNPSTSADG